MFDRGLVERLSALRTHCPTAPPPGPGQRCAIPAPEHTPRLHHELAGTELAHPHPDRPVAGAEHHHPLGTPLTRYANSALGCSPRRARLPAVGAQAGAAGFVHERGCLAAFGGFLGAVARECTLTLPTRQCNNTILASERMSGPARVIWLPPISCPDCVSTRYAWSGGARGPLGRGRHCRVVGHPGTGTLASRSREVWLLRAQR